MAITKEQIFAAADELDAAGQNPTLALVRKAVGGGSFTTISDAMNEWKARKSAQAAPLRDPAPQAVNDKLAELGADLWSVALELANNRLAAEREALEAVRVEMEAGRQEAAELADQLTAELDETKGRLVTQEEAEAAARAEAQRERERLAVANERAATAEARAGELRTELDHAHQEGAQARAELSGVRKAHADEVGALRAELTAAHAKAEATAGELAMVTARAQAQAEAHQAQAEAAAKEAERQAGEHQEQRKATAQEAARQAERYTKAQAERDQARDEASKAREDAAALRGQLEAVKDQNSQLMKAVQTPKKPEKVASAPKKN